MREEHAMGGWPQTVARDGAGPRNSRTSYVGGNNIVVTKFDYSYELSKNSNFPIYLNIFYFNGCFYNNRFYKGN